MKFNFKKIGQEFLIIFPIVFIVSVISTIVYNLIAHGYGQADWDSAIKLAIILGISIPFINQKK